MTSTDHDEESRFNTDGKTKVRLKLLLEFDKWALAHQRLRKLTHRPGLSWEILYTEENVTIYGSQEGANGTVPPPSVHQTYDSQVKQDNSRV